MFLWAFRWGSDGGTSGRTRTLRDCRVAIRANEAFDLEVRMWALNCLH